MSEQLCRDMKELLETLNKWQAQYLVVGAHALSVYTEPRGTKDLDIWVNPTPENAKRVYGALKEYGAPLLETPEQFFTERDTFLIIGVAPNRIDILKSIPGVEFDACWPAEGTSARRHPGELSTSGRPPCRENCRWATTGTSWTPPN